MRPWLEIAARTTGAELSAAVLDGLTRVLERVERGLVWPAWDEWSTRESDASTGGETRATVLPEAVRLSEGLTVEEALARARLVSEGGAYTYIEEAAAERPGDGPLAGMPFAVKDLIAVAGRPIGAGSAVREGASPEPVDAPIVARFRQAGAVFVGTTSLHEFAFGVTGINSHQGTTLNPHDRTRISGGSSSGSAVAVAEGSARIAIGTDTGGSVRIPAALCGVVGFKPAYGTYPTQGVFPLSPTLDHVGLLARSVADLRVVHAALGYPLAEVVRPRRIGILREALASCAPEVRVRLESALRSLATAGCALVEIDWPDAEETFAVSTAIMFSEAAAVHRQNILRDPNRYGADVRGRLVLGMALPASVYVAALRGRERLRAQVLTALAEVDCAIGPTVGIVAPTLAEAADPAVASRLVAHTRLANVVGLPALSLPVRGKGMPVGMQVIARTNRQVLGIGLYLEKRVTEDYSTRG